MKILNLYAGIGGNRKLWGDEHEVTAVEIDPDIAKIYKKLFPKDNVIIGDAHNFLLNHFKEFDFIWSSPPCPTHSRIRCANPKQNPPCYADMTLYQEIILLTKWFNGKWIIENVKPYYKPLIEATTLGRHLIWSNFNISQKRFPSEKISISRANEIGEAKGIDVSNIKIKNKVKVIRNCINPKIGLHILNCATTFKPKTKQ